MGSGPGRRGTDDLPLGINDGPGGRECAVEGKPASRDKRSRPEELTGVTAGEPYRL